MKWQLRESTRFQHIVRLIRKEYPNAHETLVKRAVEASAQNVFTGRYHHGCAVRILKIKGVL